jgi:hypothetical protein
VNVLPVLLVLALAAPPELKRARDRFEFGAWADAAGTLRQLLASGKKLTDVEFFDAVRRDNEPALAPLREQKRALREQERLADEARRRLLAEEQARSGPPTRLLRVQERLYLFNWMPLGGTASSRTR